MSQSNSEIIRILFLNSEALVCAALKLLLERRACLQVIAQASDRVEALRLAEQEQPDIVLLHENLIGDLDIDLLPQLMSVINQPRIILITAQTDSQYHVQAVQNGAMGVVVTQQSPEVLYTAIEKVHAGEVWLDRSLIASFLVQKSRGDTQPVVNPQARKIALLSAREREVISLVGEGLKNQQIADQLFLSEVTVRHHLTSIFKKLAVTDRLELVVYAYQNGLAQLPD